ncbi:MAG: hypothetical protein ACTHQE_18780 [Thermomicrobiales bacterium]
MTRPQLQPPPPRPPQPRCAHPGCTRFIRRGETFCLRHRSPDTTDPAGIGTGDTDLPSFPPSEYRVLLDNDLRTTLADATNEILEHGLIDELGSLRVVLLRLLLEERDLAKLVTGITRITTVAAQAMRVQHHVSGGETTETLEATADLVREVVAGLDGERGRAA